MQLKSVESQTEMYEKEECNLRPFRKLNNHQIVLKTLITLFNIINTFTPYQWVNGFNPLLVSYIETSM